MKQNIKRFIIASGLLACGSLGVSYALSLDNLSNLGATPYHVTVVNSIRAFDTPTGSSTPVEYSARLLITVYYTASGSSSPQVCYSYTVGGDNENGNSYPFSCPGPITQVSYNIGADKSGTQVFQQNTGVIALNYPANTYDTTLTFTADPNDLPVWNSNNVLTTLGGIENTIGTYSIVHK